MRRSAAELVFPRPIETTDLHQSSLRRRFTTPDHAVLPHHLSRIRPLKTACAELLDRFTSDYFLDESRHRRPDWPFRPKLFPSVEETAVFFDDGPEETARVKKWLYHRAIPFGRTVLVSYAGKDAFETSWKIFIKYVDAFYYPIIDDLVVCDETLRWCVFFWHEHTAHFGCDRPRTPDPLRDDGSVTWMLPSPEAGPGRAGEFDQE